MEDKGNSTLQDKSLQKLSLSVGDFIRYWGFRRIHGSIWTQLYLSKKPLSCKDLTVRLKLSKALISPALDELCKFKLIREAPSPNDKTKLYEAIEDVDEVIRHVLKTRERKMLEQISQHFSDFKSVAQDIPEISITRTQELGKMILAANLMLEFLLTQENLMS